MCLQNDGSRACSRRILPLPLSMHGKFSTACRLGSKTQRQSCTNGLILDGSPISLDSASYSAHALSGWAKQIRSRRNLTVVTVLNVDCEVYTVFRDIKTAVCFLPSTGRLRVCADVAFETSTQHSHSHQIRRISLPGSQRNLQNLPTARPSRWRT
jgi:hypothetical protein